jgi:hypothetical protein
VSVKSFEERKSLISTSSRAESELPNFFLSTSFPGILEPTPETMIKRKDDRSIAVYFSLPFETPAGDRSRISLVWMITYSEDEPPLVHVDPFIDLYESLPAAFASTPVAGTQPFHVVIEASAYCFDDIPRAEGKAKITIYENIARNSPAITTAYLLRDSDTSKKIQEHANPGIKIPLHHHSKLGPGNRSCKTIPAGCSSGVLKLDSLA